MPDSSGATRASVEAAAADLTGSVLAAVTYFGLSHSGEDWDHGRYHDATMGVELVRADGRRFTACWGDAFGQFGLELLAAPAADVFGNDPESSDFTRHAWWVPLTRSPMEARTVWRTGYVDSPDPAPVAVAVISRGHTVWIAAAEEAGASPGSRCGWFLGMDAVVVTADPVFAESIGLAE